MQETKSNYICLLEQLEKIQCVAVWKVWSWPGTTALCGFWFLTLTDGFKQQANPRNKRVHQPFEVKVNGGEAPL